MAYGHGLAPLLYWQLNGIGSDAVPEDILGRLRDHFQANHLRNLSLTAEMLKVLDELRARGIPALPYKGPSLAALAYGNLALREFGDLDVLVHNGDVLKAGKALVGFGYEPLHYITQAQEHAFLRYEREYPFVRHDGSVVELHWSVTPRSVSFLADVKNLWERSGSITLAGRTITTFSPEDLLLALCVHGSAHLWERLTWICDVAELVRSHRAIDWEQLLERACASGTRRMLLVGLSLADDLLDAELPTWVLNQARTDATAQALAQEMQELLFSSDEGPPVIEENVRWRLQVRMMVTLRDKLRYLIHRTTGPTSLEWQLIPLPVTLFPFYRLLRPIRLSSLGLRRLVERFS